MVDALPQLAATWHYPLLNLFWTMLWLFVWIAWIFLLIRIVTDVFRSEDLGGVAKAGWVIFLFIVPFFAALIYLIARGGSMHTRDIRAAGAADQAMRRYIQSSTASSSSTAEELHRLAELRDRGVLTPEEFAAQKAKVLA